MLARLICVCLLCLILGACQAVNTLQTKQLNALPSSLSGTFNVIKYGARHINDVETFAIIDFATDAYEFKIFSSEYNYSVSKLNGLSQAIEDASKFVAWHVYTQDVQISEIKALDGSVIGYELKPLYDRFMFGLQDVLDISYVQANKEITVYVKLNPMVEKIIYYSDSE